MITITTDQAQTLATWLRKIDSERVELYESQVGIANQHVLLAACAGDSLIIYPDGSSPGKDGS